MAQPYDRRRSERSRHPHDQANGSLQGAEASFCLIQNDKRARQTCGMVLDQFAQVSELHAALGGIDAQKDDAVGGQFQADHQFAEVFVFCQ